MCHDRLTRTLLRTGAGYTIPKILKLGWRKLDVRYSGQRLIANVCSKKSGGTGYSTTITTTKTTITKLMLVSIAKEKRRYQNPVQVGPGDNKKTRRVFWEDSEGCTVFILSSAPLVVLSDRLTDRWSIRTQSVSSSPSTSRQQRRSYTPFSPILPFDCTTDFTPRFCSTKLT